MSIWAFDQRSREPEHFNWWEDSCAFCKTPLAVLESDVVGGASAFSGSMIARVSACNQCGWWRAHRSTTSYFGVHRISRTIDYGAAASLREFDLTDISAPIDEVRDYLMAKFESRSMIHPRLFEETVGSVFADLGWKPQVTSYSADDGIDVFLEKDGEVVGVQVKRYENAIKVEQVRSLAGALLLNGLTRGIFVTTSSFQRGVESAVRRYKSKGYKIELMDAQGLLDALQVAQRNKYQSGRDFPKSLLQDLPVIEGYTFDPYYNTRTRLDPETWKWSEL